MGESRLNFSFDGKSPLSRFLLSLLIVFFAGIFLFPLLLLAGTFIYGGNTENWLTVTASNFGGKGISFLRLMVILQEVTIFIIPAIIILYLMKPSSQKGLKDFESPELYDVILVIILAFCLFPLTSFTGQLNSGMHFPDWLSSLEQWMKVKEDNATRLVNLLIASNTFGIMLFNIFMLALIPAIGEELIFRGVFQKIFYSLFKSGHLAIWVTAFAFSALHFQFFGFIPRFILGLVFGYLFYWSGTLWLPVISHFVNNAVPVISAYIQGKGNFGILSWEQVIILPLTIVIIIIILQYFRSNYKRKLRLDQEESQLKTF